MMTLETRDKIISIGVVGTAKNTGKTTTLSAILSEGLKKGKSFALTSIGYDGERVDNLTLLPKPRLFVLENQILATSDKCVQWAGAKTEVLKKTGIETSLGEIFIVRVLKPGLIVLAGPNKQNSLQKIRTMLSEYAEKILVDGALGRIAPFSIVDALIFTTGAARNTNIDFLADEMLSILEIFSLPASDWTILEDRHRNLILLLNEKGEEFSLSIGSVLSGKDVVSLVSLIRHHKTKKIFIPGAISHRAFQQFIETVGDSINGCEITFNSAPTMLSGWEPSALHKLIVSLNAGNAGLLTRNKEKGVKISLRKKQQILAVTVNPFYPKREHRGSRYTPAFINVGELKKVFKYNLQIPIFDIFNDGADKLFGLIDGFTI